MLPFNDPVLIFAVLIFGMLIAPIFSSKLKIPDLVTLIAFGAILGPGGFYLVEHNTGITLLGSVGLIYIMFLAGLEINLHQFMRSYEKSVIFGLLTFLIPEILGSLAAKYLLGLSWPASILLASMFSSHTLLAYPYISKMGLSKREPVVITVGATIITDVLALLVLAVIVDSAKGIPLTIEFWITIIFGITILTVLAWKGIPFVSRLFFRHVSEESNTQFLFVIVLVCFLGYLSYFAQMEPIIGAFLAGAAFNRLIPENSRLMSQVQFAGNTLFIPFFLISVGMLIDLEAMFSGMQTWYVAGIMVLAVLITKYLAAHICRIFFGYSRNSGNLMFGLSVVQAAATLAAVMIGYKLNIFDESILNGTIIMILITCTLGSWLSARYGRAVVSEIPKTPLVSNLEQRLLVSVSNSETAGRLLDLAFIIRNKEMPGGINLLNIAIDQQNVDASVAEGEKILTKCLAHAASADFKVNPEIRVSVNVSDSIVHTVKELRSSTLLVGWPQKKSAGVRFFGTIMNHLTEACPSRLLFCRIQEPVNTCKRVLMLLPPHSGRRRDLKVIIRDVKVLSSQIGAELNINLISDESGELQMIVESIRPKCRLNFFKSQNWDKAQKDFLNDIRDNDLIYLPVDRKSGVLWTPAFDYLSEKIIKNSPENNLLVAYPSMSNFNEENVLVSSDEGSSLFPNIIAKDINSDETFHQALHFMAQTAFSKNEKMSSEAYKALLESAESYPVELSPGTVLVHARSGKLDNSLLMVIYSDEDIKLSGMPNTANIIFVLLNSEDEAPENHLKILSKLAGFVLNLNQSGKLSSVEAAEEISVLLMEEKK